MKDRSLWRSLPPELKMLLALVLILGASSAGTSFLGKLPEQTRLERLREILPWIGGIGAALVVLTAGVWLYRRRRRKAFGRELELQTAGPTRREEAEREREYKRKWLRGVEQLKASGKTLYDLPWYVLIGEPAGGKTMTLINSGMDFPLGKEELPGFGGTRNYNWWFTNDAVILDTAGRLVFEQEGTTDKKEWEEFLRTLKSRRRCPLNGCIVGLPADKLMKDSPEQREAAATILRDRLRQMQQVLGVRFPVYLLVTKMDLVAGFTEFFDACDGLQRNQLFGWSRPGAFEAAYDPADFPKHFRELLGRLEDLRVRFLCGERGMMFSRERPTTMGSSPSTYGGYSDQRAWVFTFPAAFANLESRLHEYVNVLFARNVFAEPLFFRGFYFTSALQEGKPILDLLGARLAREDLQDLKQLFPQSRAHFIYDFYTRKVAPEQGLVFRSAKEIQRSRLARKATYWVMLPLLCVMLVAFGLGFWSLETKLQEPRDHAEKALALVEKARQQPSQHNPAFASVPNLIESLEKDDAELRSGWAILFTGNTEAIAKSLEPVRRELFGHTLLRNKVAQIEDALIEAGSGAVLTPSNFPQFRNAVIEYVRWWTGQRTLNSSFEQLSGVLDESQRGDQAFYDQLDVFLNKLQGDPRHAFSPQRDGQNVISVAIERAKGYTKARLDQLSSTGGASERPELRTSMLGRYQSILTAGQALASAESVDAWRAAAAGWDQACGGDGNRCGSAWLLPLQEFINEQVRSATPATSLEDQLAELNSTAGRFWKDMVDVLSSARDAAGRDTLLEQARAGAGDFEAQLEQARTRSTQTGDDCNALLATRGAGTALTPSECVVQVRTILDGWDGLIREAQTARDNPATAERLQGWVERAGSLVGDAEPAAFCSGVPNGSAWEPEKLRELCRGVSRTQRRVARAILLQDIFEAIGHPAVSLSTLVPRSDSPERPAERALPTIDSLIKTMEHKQLLADSLNRLGSPENSPLPGAVELQWVLLRLDESMATAVRDYLGAWSERYEQFRLRYLSDLCALVKRTPKWQTFVKLVVPEDRLRVTERFDEMWQPYAGLVQELDQHLVRAVAATESPAAEAVARALRENKPEKDGPFARWFQAVLQGRSAIDLGQGHQAWIDLGLTLADLRDKPESDGSKPVALPNVGAALLGTPPAELSARLQEDFLASQLQWFGDVAVALLRSEVEDRVQSVVDELGAQRPFPFSGGAPTLDRVPQLDHILSKLGDMASVDERLRVSVPGQEAALAARREMLKNAAEWRRLFQQSAFKLKVIYPLAQNARVSDHYRKLTFKCESMFDRMDRPVNVGVTISTSQTFDDDNSWYSWHPARGLLIHLSDPQPGGSRRREVELVRQTLSDVALFWLLDSARTETPRFRKTWPIDGQTSVTLEFELRDSLGQPVTLPPALNLPHAAEAASALACPWE